MTFCVIFMLFVSFSSSNAKKTDVCNTLDIWSASLIDIDTEETIKTYYPEEFFTPEGAIIPEPELIQDLYIVPYFEFSMTSCQFDSFYVEFEYESYTSYNYIESQIIFDVAKSYRLDFRDLLSMNPNVREYNSFSDSWGSETKNMLRSKDENQSFWFKYKDGVIEKSDGKSKRMNVCRLYSVGFRWYYGRGILKSILIKIDDKEYYEDFTDCHNAMIYDDCPPEEPDYIRASYKLPTCETEYLRLEASSNIPDLHWVSLSEKYEGAKVVIPYDEMTGGCYAVWGQKDMCSIPIYDTVCPPIPDLSVKESFVQDTLCWNDPFYVGGKRVTESGIYTETLKSNVTRCDSIVTYDLSIFPADTIHILDTIYRCDINLNDPFIRDTIDSFDECPKLQIAPAGVVSDADKIIIKDYTVNNENTEITIFVSNNSGNIEYICPTIGYESEENIIPLIKSGMYEIIAYDLETHCSDSIHYLNNTGIKPDLYWNTNNGGLWKIQGLERYNSHVVKIYDRFGRLLLTYNNNFKGWDGTYLGHKMPSTDYWYTIELDNGTYKSYGHFTLIRWDE